MLQSSLTCWVVANGVVASVVSELQLEGLSSKCLSEDLVSHANPEDRLLAKDLLGVLHSVRGSRRIALKA